MTAPENTRRPKEFLWPTWFTKRKACMKWSDFHLKEHLRQFQLQKAKENTP